MEMLQHRDSESGSFACAGLGARKKVAARAHERDGFSLYGSRGGIAFFIEGFKNRIDDIEVGKLHMTGTD
jgi:hypothetical protein